MAFNGSRKGLLDSKEFRKAVNAIAETRFGLLKSYDNASLFSKTSGLISLLDSSYISEALGPAYASDLRAYSFESAKFLEMTNKIISDIIFDDTRGEYLSQNIASFLFPYNRFALTNSSDIQFKNFLLSIVQAYFGGSTKSNIESVLKRFLNIPIAITEYYLLDRLGVADISKQFMFSFAIDTSITQDIAYIQQQTAFLLGIIKPAHTFYETNILFQESFDIYRKGCVELVDPHGQPIISHDGFNIKSKQANTSICDTTHYDLYSYYYEDLRNKNCNTPISQILGEDITEQASPRYVKSGLGGTWSSISLYDYHTHHGPICKPDGTLAEISDVIVKVNNIAVEITAIIPLSGVVTLRNIPPVGSTVTIDYYYVKGYVGFLQTNNYDTVLNHWKDTATEFSYKSVLYPNSSLELRPPLKIDYKYIGFELFDSSVTNCPETLLFNQLGLRNRLNDATLIKSQYSTVLGPKTPLVSKSLEKKDFWRKLTGQQFILNATNFHLNVKEDRLFGDIHKPDYYPFYSGLDITAQDNGGVDSLTTICVSDNVQFEFRLASENLRKISMTYNSHFFTNSSQSNNGDKIWGTDSANYQIDIDALYEEDLNLAIQDELPDNSAYGSPIQIDEVNQELFNGDWFYSNNSETNNTKLLPHNILTDSDYIIDYTNHIVAVGPFTLNYKNLGAVSPQPVYHSLNALEPLINSTVYHTITDVIEIRPV